MKISYQNSLAALTETKQLFIQFFSNGSISVELYKPEGEDNQQPHDRDEIYIIVDGSGDFNHNGVIYKFNPGDFFFVAAWEHHRFSNFSKEFATWVIFCSEPRDRKVL